MGDDIDSLPFRVIKDAITRHVWAFTSEHCEEQHTPCDDHIEDKRRLQTRALLELKFLDPATTLEDLEINLDLPAAQVPLKLFDSLLGSFDDKIGQQ